MKIYTPVLTRYARHGGVTQFLSNLIGWSLKSNGQYQIFDHTGEVKANFKVNTFSTWKSYVRKISLIWHMIFFASKLKSVDHVLLNPSLGKKSMHREMYYAKKCVMQGKEFSIFFHGWNWEFAAALDTDKNLRAEYISLINHASNIFVLANAFKNKLVSWGGHENKIHLAKSMVNNSLIPEQYNTEFSPTSLKILFLSRVTKSKGIFEAVDAFKLHLTHSPESQFTIAGTGEDLDGLKEYIKVNNIENITFVGFADEEMKRDLMRSHDVFILPSYSEGMPISIFEAMAFGLTIITRPVGGIPDFFNSNMGFLIDSLLPEDFSSAMNMIVNDKGLKVKVAQYNHKYVIENVTSDIVSQTIMSKLEASYAK